MTEWEYKSEYIALLFSESESPKDFIHPHGGQLTYLWQKKLQDELDKIGGKGWELVAITPEIISGESIDAYALFKRPKSDN